MASTIAPRKRSAAKASMRAPKAAAGLSLTAPTVARLDGKCRLALGTVAQPGEQFTIFREPSGNIVLQPVKLVPANEAWLWENKNALGSVLQGMREAEEGQTQDLGDFARYARE